MTPGVAKSRAELPWLYYPRADGVIINSHNFQSSIWTPAVNGKNPIAAWCPSRDTAGNGTTTLTDLTGNGYNGSLTNMSAGSDWVSNTEAGGVRALDLDGTNDHILVSASLHSAFQSRTISGWFKIRSVGSGDSTPTLFNSNSMYLAIDGANNQPQFFNGSWRNGSSGITLNTWFHVMWGVAFSGSTPTTTKIWLNGSAVYSSPALALGTGDSSFRIGARGDVISSPYCVDGLFDDVRLFHQLLDDTDAADLYASGSGRGVQA